MKSYLLQRISAADIMKTQTEIEVFYIEASSIILEDATVIFDLNNTTGNLNHRVHHFSCRLESRSANIIELTRNPRANKVINKFNRLTKCRSSYSATRASKLVSR